MTVKGDEVLLSALAMLTELGGYAGGDTERDIDRASAVSVEVTDQLVAEGILRPYPAVVDYTLPAAAASFTWGVDGESDVHRERPAPFQTWSVVHGDGTEQPRGGAVSWLAWQGIWDKGSTGEPRVLFWDRSTLDGDTFRVHPVPAAPTALRLYAVIPIGAIRAGSDYRLERGENALVVAKLAYRLCPEFGVTPIPEAIREQVRIADQVVARHQQVLPLATPWRWRRIGNLGARFDGRGRWW